MPARDTRKGDRHKNTNRQKGYIRPSRRNPENPDIPRPKGRPRKEKPEKPGWQGNFVTVDGEGWDGRYTLLACSALDYDLYSPDGLSTRACLRYLTGWGVKGRDALVGFGLSYDFENLLRDLPDEDYKKLLDGEEVGFYEFSLKYIPRKLLEIKRTYNKVDEQGKPRKKTVFLQDSLGFFQASFQNALKKFNIPVPEIITEGKALRGAFEAGNIKFIKDYNREELRLLIELLEELRKAGEEAFKAVGLKPNFSPRTWYGPGGWASNFLKQTNWIEEHPDFSGHVFEALQKDMMSYYGPAPVPQKPLQHLRDLENALKDARKYAQGIIKGLADSLRESEEFDDIFFRIRERGGIGPSRSGAWTGEYAEFIPRHLKRKNARPLDEVADELGMTAAELLYNIQNRKPKKSWQAIKEEAGREALYIAEYQAVQETISKLEEELQNLAPEIDLEALTQWRNLEKYPFAAAFYGGRIESAAVGEFNVRLYDYDINSAYPFAISNLPHWEPEDLIRVDAFDPANRIGMYFIEWECPDGFNMYPFPYRAQTGNVFFPRAGRGWYMSPEVNSAQAVWPGCVKVLRGYVLKDTDGAGDGLTKLPEEKLCTTARKISLMASIRLVAKKKGLSFEKALKLVMNSVYGKTIQQVGSHRYLNPFAASWITSTCRAIIARTIGQDSGNSIISVMTDGILTRKPLPVKLGENLGEFELTEFDKAIQFMPGVYYLENSKTGKKESKYRGMDKGFDPHTAKEILWQDVKKYKGPDGQEIKEGFYPVKINVFVTRNLAMHQPGKFDAHKYEFFPVEKEEEFSLRSKRKPGRKGFRLHKKERHKFFHPKEADWLEMKFKGSKPYVLDLPAVEEYDTADTGEKMMDENRINSLLEIDNFDLMG